MDLNRSRPGPRAKVLLPYGWPLYVLFYGYPLWWVLGLAEFAWPIVAVPMLANLVVRRDKLRMPRGFGVYVLFMLWMMASAVEVHGTPKLFGFAYRAVLYTSAPIFALYIVNAPKAVLPNRAVVRIMVVFWFVVVGGGLLGLAVPHLQITTLMARALPKRLQANPFVFNLVHPKTAQVHSFLGFPVPRPAAPFVFTNDWGGNFALLVPFVLASWSEGNRIGRSRFERLLVPVSLLPVVFSLDRTLWACLGLVVIYGGMRFGARRRRGVIQGFVAVVLLGALVVNFAPTRQLITDRVATPHSNRGRSILYNESVALALHSPLLGYGGPQTSTVNPNLPPVGTQGQVWTILVSNGIPAAFFFFAYFLSVMWQTRRARSALGLWCHIVVLVALFQSPFYGLLASQIHLVFIAIALAFREASEPDQPHGRVPAARVVERPTPAAGSRDVGRHDGMDLVRP